MKQLTVNTESDRITVSARELHKALEIGTDFRHWFPRMCDYGFLEGSDFRTFLTESNGGRQGTDAEITIEMAKQICMIQRSEKGRQYREYFLQIEKEWNSPEKVMARALVMAEDRIKKLGTQLEEMKPKAVFADAVAASPNTILIGELAKILKANGYQTGQNRLFETLRNDGYLINRKGSDFNMPTQRSMELGLMRIKETAITHSDGHVSVGKTVKITGKGQQYFINKYCPKS